MRHRRRKQGSLRQLNLWVLIETHEELKAISQATGNTMGEALHDVLANRHEQKPATRNTRKSATAEITPQLELNLFE